MNRSDYEPRRKAVPRPGSVIPDGGWMCEACGVVRRTAETLRVHKALAHGEQP
jgi:hypothetical protein